MLLLVWIVHAHVVWDLVLHLLLLLLMMWLLMSLRFPLLVLCAASNAVAVIKLVTRLFVFINLVEHPHLLLLLTIDSSTV